MGNARYEESMGIVGFGVCSAGLKAFIVLHHLPLCNFCSLSTEALKTW